MSKSNSTPKTQHVGIYGALIHQEKILLVKRAETESYPGLYELPGGGIDFSESPERALVREFLEETGIIIDPFVPIKTFSNISTDGDRQYIRIVYLVEYADENKEVFLSDEHDEYIWADVQEVDELFSQINEEMFLAIKLALEVSSKSTEDYGSGEGSSIN